MQHWVLVVLSYFFVCPVSVPWIQPLLQKLEEQMVWKTVSQNHRKGEVRRQLWRLAGLKAGSPGPGCSGLCLARFSWISSRKDSRNSVNKLFQYLITVWFPLPLIASCLDLELYFLMVTIDKAVPNFQSPSSSFLFLSFSSSRAFSLIQLLNHILRICDHCPLETSWAACSLLCYCSSRSQAGSIPFMRTRACECKTFPSCLQTTSSASS